MAFFILELSTQSCFPGCSHRQLRGFRREEHTAVHVLCLSESVGRVAQNMSKKAWATNRKRSMSVGISGDSRLYKQSFQEIPLPSFPFCTACSRQKWRCIAIGIGIIGAGKVGTTMGKYFVTHGEEVSGFYSRTVNSAKEAAKFCNTKYFSELDSLIEVSDTLFITVTDGQ